MNTGFRQSMGSLHTWVGLLPGWLLFVIFLFGTVSFFQHEISRWMRPELTGHIVTKNAMDAVSNVMRSKDADLHWTIVLPFDRGGEPVKISWTPGADETGMAGGVTFDPVTGREVSVRDTQGGAFLYRFHYNLHYLPHSLARYLVCVASLSMLVAILSGIVTHKKIFADFFMLRFGKGQRSWLDGHNAAAVLALPFTLMITYTGLATLLFTLMPWAISANFASTEEFFPAAYPPSPKIEASGRLAPLLPLSELIGRSETIWGDAKPFFIKISNAGDAAAVAELWPQSDKLGGYKRPLYLNASTGALVRDIAPIDGALATHRTMIDLHAGRFASTVLRWLYFLSGVAGTFMVATGLVLWTVKRRAKLSDPAHPHFGFRLVEWLNIGVITGALAGIAVYFLANRLLPLGTANRADWEIDSLFIAWGGFFVWTIARPVKQVWIEALAACAALYALVPVVNALTTMRGLIPSLIARDWVFVSFDLTMLMTAAACALAAWKAATHKPKMTSRRKARERVEAVV